ncbi:MAG: DNA recombination protein RmuC [Prolixibacteraceae bacterium]|nr:DNA recombination protein RmuC [Prolixibacteraceae bacterium]
MNSELIFLLAGLAAGVVIGYLFVRLFLAKKDNQAVKEWEGKLNQVIEEKRQVEIKIPVLEERLAQKHGIVEKLESELTGSRELNELLKSRVDKAEVEYRNLQEKLQTQKAELEELQKKFTTEFENIANKILKKNSEEFSIVTNKNMDDILKPIREKFESFEKKVEDTYLKSKNDQVDLKAELKKLSELNVRIGDEARNLTKALKGDVKKQGNWGEIVLERILERSGLNEGEEYEKQYSDFSEDGKRIQPDIVVFLPDKKHIIIDSKVSLVAYEKVVNEQDETERNRFLKEHILSLKTHIKGLSEKHYQSARNLNSPDFVLMFLPIESSFSIAIQEDQDLFAFAWDQKVVIVSPSTLLATLRTIASIWQQENQTKNALEIARQGGALYDKFVGFVADMQKIGGNLSSTQKTYNDAMGKLQTGSGNLINRVENIKKLGAKASKELPGKLLEN